MLYESGQKHLSKALSASQSAAAKSIALVQRGFAINIFFDTEFTALSSEPHLLSIGLVADSGDSLYIEFTNGWSEADCSFWVREHVMPMLGKGERLTRREAVARITSWLLSFSTSLPTLLGETTWDTTLLADLMREFGVAPDCFCLKVISFSGKEQANTFEAAKRRYLEYHQLTAHHALSDAWAFHAAWHDGHEQLVIKLPESSN